MYNLYSVKDHDHDGRVSLNDFQTAVYEDKLMLEALGKCLPDDKVFEYRLCINRCEVVWSGLVMPGVGSMIWMDA